jgi:hypothetical protein
LLCRHINIWVGFRGFHNEIVRGLGGVVKGKNRVCLTGLDPIWSVGEGLKRVVKRGLDIIT